MLSVAISLVYRLPRRRIELRHTGIASRHDGLRSRSGAAYDRGRRRGGGGGLCPLRRGVVVREPKEIEELGTRKGFVNIPIGELEARVNELPKDKTILTA